MAAAIKSFLRTVALLIPLLIGFSPPLFAQEKQAAPEVFQSDAFEVLTPEQWRQVDESVEGALAWLAAQQQADGSFPTRDAGQPAVTALAVMAFIAGGQTPGVGPYGLQIHRAIDYVLGTQQPDGLFCYRPPAPDYTWQTPSHTAIYNHAIAGLMLCEVYGMTDPQQTAKIRSAVERAIAYTLDRQRTQVRHPGDRGGWRYITWHYNSESDLSVSSWQLMFLRAAKNAGFEVPFEAIDAAMQYIQRTYNPSRGTFMYGLVNDDRDRITRAMAGAGILSLALGGLHDTGMAHNAGEFILQNNFNEYRAMPLHAEDRYFYGIYYCTLAMFQLGGRYWEQYYPDLVQVLLSHQTAEGWWHDEIKTDHYGTCYTSSLCVLALTAPYQLLPIYQR